MTYDRDIVTDDLDVTETDLEQFDESLQIEYDEEARKQADDIDVQAPDRERPLLADARAATPDVIVSEVDGLVLQNDERALEVDATSLDFDATSLKVEGIFLPFDPIFLANDGLAEQLVPTFLENREIVGQLVSTLARFHVRLRRLDEPSRPFLPSSRRLLPTSGKDHLKGCPWVPLSLQIHPRLKQLDARALDFQSVVQQLDAHALRFPPRSPGFHERAAARTAIAAGATPRRAVPKGRSRAHHSIERSR